MPKMEPVDRIDDRLAYLRSRQSEIEAELPRTNLERVAKRKAIASIAEDILRLERRKSAVETVIYRDVRFFNEALTGGTLLKGAVSRSKGVIDSYAHKDVVEFTI